MVQINFAQKTVNVKIVYYGPGMSGKTTNLEVVHQRSPEANHGELTSISTDGDRTLFFDYMPLELGTVAGMRTCFQLYTVPGQVYYNSTRKLVLQGVDGVIFVADSGRNMLEQNLESLRNLEENLNEYGKSLATMAHVIQWNKRDLPDVMSVDELEKHLNHHGAPSFEGIANTGQGVFPTLKALAAAVLKDIMKESAGGGGQAAPEPAMPAQGGAFGAGQPAAPAMPAAMPTAGAAQPAPAARPTAGAPEVGTPQVAGAPAMQVAAQATAVAPQATAQTSAGGLMQMQQQQGQVAQPAAAPQRKARPRNAASAKGSAAGRARRSGAAAPAKSPAKKSSVSTGVFVVAAAGIGAAIAWAALTFLV